LLRSSSDRDETRVDRGHRRTRHPQCPHDVHFDARRASWCLHNEVEFATLVHSGTRGFRVAVRSLPCGFSPSSRQNKSRNRSQSMPAVDQQSREMRMNSASLKGLLYIREPGALARSGLGQGKINYDLVSLVGENSLIAARSSRSVCYLARIHR